MDLEQMYRQLRRTVTEFEVTEDHLRLLRRAYINWNDVEDGAPTIDPKRPYGNSQVAADVADILNPGLVKGGAEDRYDYIEANRDRLLRLHVETGMALQICLSVGAFEAGVYRRADTYTSTSWQRVGAEPKAPATIAQDVADLIAYYDSKFGFTPPELLPQRLAEFRQALLYTIGIRDGEAR